MISVTHTSGLPSSSLVRFITDVRPSDEETLEKLSGNTSSCVLHYPHRMEVLTYSASGDLTAALQQLAPRNHTLKPLEVLTNGDLRAFSGARLFRLFDETNSCSSLMKAYGKLEEFSREIEGMAWVKEQHFKHFVVPEALDFRLVKSGDKEWGVLLIAALPGASVEELFLEVGQSSGALRVPRFARLEDAIAGVAATLAELHEVGGRGAALRDDYNERFLRSGRNMLECLDEIPRTAPLWQNRESFIRRGSSLLNSLPEVIEFPTAVHGDANTGNFLVFERFTSLIDLTHLSFSLDEEGQGRGDAMRDVGNFYQKLRHSAARSGLSSCEGVELSEHFLRCYRDAGGRNVEGPSFAAHRLRTGLGELFRAAERSEEVIPTSLLEQYVRGVEEIVFE